MMRWLRRLFRRKPEPVLELPPVRVPPLLERTEAILTSAGLFSLGTALQVGISRAEVLDKMEPMFRVIEMHEAELLWRHEAGTVSEATAATCADYLDRARTCLTRVAKAQAKGAA